MNGNSLMTISSDVNETKNPLNRHLFLQLELSAATLNYHLLQTPVRHYTTLQVWQDVTVIELSSKDLHLVFSTLISLNLGPP